MQTIEQLEQELARLKREVAALRRSKVERSSNYRDYVPVHGGRIHKDVASQFDIIIRPEVLRYKVEYLEYNGDQWSHTTVTLKTTYAELCKNVDFALATRKFKNFYITIV
jgi:hypothetical protein